MDFFKLLGFAPKGKVILVRHTLSIEPPPLAEYARSCPENFAEWQRIQQQDNRQKGDFKNMGRNFWGCDSVVSFGARPFYGGRDSGVSGKTARFIGVFHNESGDSPEKFSCARGLSPELGTLGRENWQSKQTNLWHLFNFRRDARFQDWEGRVDVNWVWGNQNWVYVYKPWKDKVEVSQRLPKGDTDRLGFNIRDGRRL